MDHQTAGWSFHRPIVTSYYIEDCRIFNVTAFCHEMFHNMIFLFIYFVKILEVEKNRNISLEWISTHCMQYPHAARSMCANFHDHYTSLLYLSVTSVVELWGKGSTGSIFLLKSYRIFANSFHIKNSVIIRWKIWICGN